MLRDRVVARGGVVRWSVAAALLTGAVFYLAMVYGHAAPEKVPDTIADPGALTGWGLPISRVVADLAGFAVVGCLLAAAFLLPAPSGGAQGHAAQAVRHASRAAWVWAAAIVVELAFSISDIFAVPVGDLTYAEISSYLLDTDSGRAFLVQCVLAIAVAVLARWVLGVPAVTAVLGLALLALVPPVLTGHSASSGSHMLAVASLLLHVAGASLWVGGLLALGWVATLGSKRLPAAVRRYSALAAWCIAIVGLSGVVNASVRIEKLHQVFTTEYGNLLLAKVLALLAMGAFGLSHRRWVIPRLERSGRVGRTFMGLAAVELLVMFATIGLAVALSRTPPPVPDDLYTDPVTELLGEPMPAAPTVGRLLWSFSPNGVGLVVVSLGAALYIAGLLVMRRRGDAWPVGRTVSWFVGLAVIAWATFGGLGAYAHVLFSAHMVSHMLLAMVAPIFLVLAAPITLALRTLPGPREPGEIGPRQLLANAIHSRAAVFITHPVFAAALFVGSLYVLYFSGLFTLMMETHTGHALMELHFLAVGFLFYYVIVGVDPSARRVPPLGRFAVLLVSMPFHAFFSVTIMSSATVLAESYWTSLDRPYQTDLLADQNLGGSVSWAMGELPLLIVMVALFVQWLRSDQRESKRFDRRGDAALDEYNAYLASLNEHDR
ncbi:cytochrome c oxidase assembly protein [Solicola gregarius]|uniref:Bifunctional copper resistance protein CopD/cytochrome c oxidase assembly protein n=1 Tax=Solicola gregarius TaxID=2908642 RepID=A0AA46THC2_9ACTN|nr:cytochrome c oxidase assembly protein [Solicola gregarius]UYM05150.1 bifunctional copper resistance protein CopD/cytochrome c oxidase assembly protein [Solicola gregarius]